MKSISKAFFAILLLSSVARAEENPVVDAVFSTVEDTFETTTWYAEQAARLYAINYAGKKIQENVAMTRVIEDLFKFTDNIKFVKDHGLRSKIATIGWGAALFALTKKLVLGNERITRVLKKDAPFLETLLRRLLTFRSEK